MEQNLPITKTGEKRIQALFCFVISLKSCKKENDCSVFEI